MTILLYRLFLANEGAVRDRIRISGNVELTEVEIAFKSPGRLTELGVEEGDFVDVGSLIGRLDTVQLDKEKEHAVARLSSLHSRIRELQTMIRFQQARMEAQIELRRAEIAAARFRLLELQRGSRRQEIEEAEAAVARARATLEKSEGDWQRAQVLFGNEDISRSQFEGVRSAYQSAEASLEQVIKRAELVREGPREETIERAQAELDRAQSALKQTEATSLEIETNREAVRTLQAEIRGSKAQVALIQSRLADAVAHSPISGVVLVRTSEPGEVVAAGTSVATIGNLDRPWVRGFINEDDLGRVKLGASVLVTSDSFPGKTYEGILSFISSEAEFTPKQIQTEEQRVKLVYRVKVDVANPNQELKLNMPVDAEILLDERGLPDE